VKPYKVLLTNSIFEAPAARIAEVAEVIIAADQRPETLVEAAADVDVIVVRAWLPPSVIDRAPRLRGFVRHGAGIDFIPVEAASQHGIAVANVPGGNAISVAEYALGQMLSLTHRLTEADQTLRTEGWAATKALSDGTVELTGRRLGIVGIGEIGRALARMAHFGLQMSVSAYRPSMAPVAEYIDMVSLDTLFEESDVIVVACPLNDHTRGMVDRDLISKMKPDAMLVNVARGAIIDEAALIDALRNRSIRGAALDVFTTQPLPADSPLLALDNVVVSGHIAGMTHESMLRMGHKTADQVIQLLQGQMPEHLCNVEARAAIEARLRSLT
jgi:Phosphoglycerate dehydrogenase and related dehydrogenases